MKKNTLLYFIIYSIVLITNVLIVLLHISNASISSFSLPAIFLMAAMIINAIISYCLRHKGNYLPFIRLARPNPFLSDRDYTFEDEYLNRFFFLLKVYCLVIPFYIPQIFLASSHLQSLWALVPFFVPQAVHIVMGIRGTLREVKKEEQLKEELLEQERREELGEWK